MGARKGAAPTSEDAENRDRRHLTSSQKSAIAVQMGIYEDEVRKARQRMKDGAAKGGAANGNGEGGGTVPPPSVPATDKKEAAQEAANRVGGTSAKQVRQAAWLNENAPSELEAVRRGESGDQPGAPAPRPQQLGQGV